MTAACAAFVAVLSLAAAYWSLPGLQRFFFVWDHNFGPAVSLACGRPFADVAHPAPELVEFLNRRRPDFDCRWIAADAEFAPINAYANGIPYFLRGLAFYWRWRGVSWPALAPLFAAMYAAANVLVFFLFRYFLGTAWALACAVVYALSPSEYFAATYYEHFTKVPIFLGLLLVIVGLARARRVTRGRLLAMAAVAGILLGVGFGVRADLWLLVVPCLAALAWFCGGAPRPAVATRVAACGLLIAIAVLVAAPAAATGGRSYFWLQLVEGLSSDFNADLSVRPSLYEWIPTYSDELGASWMQAHDPVWPVADWQRQERAGRAAYFRIMRDFPADFVTRPLAAALKVPIDSLRTQPSFAAQFAAAGPNFFTRTGPVWRALATLGLAVLFLLGLSLVGLAQRDGRQALFFTLLVLYLGGATAIAFLPRHRWHLYFIGFLTLGVAARFLVAALRRQVDAPWTRALGAVAIALAVVATVLIGTRAYQDRRVALLIESVLAAPRTPLRVDWREPPGRAPVAVAADLVRRFEDASAAQPRFEYADYVTATFSRDDCPAASVRLRYRASQPAYDHTLTVPLDFSGGSRRFTYAFPAYATRYQAAYGFFEGIEVPARRCLADAAVITDRAALPLLITWHIPERWRDRTLHQSIVFPPEAR